MMTRHQNLNSLRLRSLQYVVFERVVRARSARISLSSFTFIIHFHHSLSSFTFIIHLLISLMSSSEKRENLNCITHSWNITRNNINRAFSLFLGYAIDRHDARTQVHHRSVLSLRTVGQFYGMVALEMDTRRDFLLSFWCHADLVESLE